MLNLNYNTNLTTTTAGGTQRSAFFPFLNNDPFSASLVAAIPAQIFYNPNNRSPLFGASTNPYYDVSYLIRGTGTQLQLTATGSNSSQISNFSSSPWGNNFGYNTSMLIPIKAAINAGTGSSLTITTSSNWVVESWVAFPTASNNKFPNHFLLNKVADFGNQTDDNSYTVSIVTTTKPVSGTDGNFPTGTGPYPISGGLCLQIFKGISPNYGYVTLWPPQEVSQSYSQNGWYHFAVSNEIKNLGGVNYSIYRGFVNGNQIFEQYSGSYGGGTPTPINQANSAPNTPVLLMGNLFEYVQLQLGTLGNPDTWVTQSAAVFQDFRFYNGTNKNYTASFDVNSVVKPIVIGNAY